MNETAADLSTLYTFLTGTTTYGYVGEVAHNLFLYLGAWTVADATVKWEVVEAASSEFGRSVDSILRFAGIAQDG